MHLFLTGVLPFLAHDHPSAVAFLTCRHHNFHSSIIPEFLSDEERVKPFCEARQQNQIKVDHQRQCANLYNLFVQTPLMQFSPSLIIFHKDSAQRILKPLLETKYFTRTLQRCSVVFDIPLTNELLQALSKVQSLTNLDLGWSEMQNEQLEIIINSFPSLETLTIQKARHLQTLDPKTAINISSPPPAAIRTLRSLTLDGAGAFFTQQFVPNFFNLRKLELSSKDSSQELDLLPLSSSFSHLTHLDLQDFTLENTESLKNCYYLATLQFRWCKISDLSFLTQENHLPHLTKLLFKKCEKLSPSSFAPLAHVPNLHTLEIVDSAEFDNGCLQHLENMKHLRKLDLSCTKITGDSQSFKTLMRNSFQLEELNLNCCHVGGQGAISGALYSTHSRLRVLNLSGFSHLVDDDLNGIDALKNTLEVLHLSGNLEMTNETLVHCRELVKLKVLNFGCCGIDDLSPLKHCLNLQEVDVSYCGGLTDDSFKVFSEEPDSFPNLRVLNMSFCSQLTEKVLEHLANNDNLVCQLKELNVGGMSKILSSSATARNNLFQLKELRALIGILDWESPEDDENQLKGELMRGLKNLEEVL